MAEKNILVLGHNNYYNELPREELARLGCKVYKYRFHELEESLIEDSLTRIERYAGAVIWTGSEIPDHVRTVQETVKKIEEYNPSLPIIAVVAGPKEGSEYEVYRAALKPRIRILSHMDMTARVLAKAIDDIIFKR